MPPTFIGNPYINEVVEDSDGMDDDDWDDLLGQFPLPVFPGDSTEEDNVPFGTDDEEDADEDSIYHMIHEGDFGFEVDDDDADYNPHDEDDDDDSQLFSDDDFEAGPPVFTSEVIDLSYLSASPPSDDSGSPWNMSTEDLAGANVTPVDSTDESQPELELNNEVQKPSSESPSSSGSVGETAEKVGSDST